MTNRKIPYGYRLNMGKAEPHPQESETVRRIYADYIGGKTLPGIAQTLTAEKVEFLPGRHDWNKNRIKRILEDSRYCGNATYPAIVGEDVYRQAQAVRSLKNTQQTTGEPPPRLPCPVECALCGAKMERKHANHLKPPRAYWYCPTDGHTVSVTDDSFFGQITALLNRLIADPTLIHSGPPPTDDPPLAVKRLQNEVDRQLDSIGFDKVALTADIFALATEKYAAADSDNILSKMLRAELEVKAPLSCYDPALFDRLVASIRLAADGEITLILKNNQPIQKERFDANHDSPVA